VSSDCLESSTPGAPFTTKGSASKLRYYYVSFWVDHVTSFVYITFQASKAASELVRSKMEFEEFSARFNVQIKNIRADNGIYTAQLFKETILLHAMAKWPMIISEHMWTFALHAVNFHNCSIRKDKTISPYGAFTGKTPPWSLSDFRVFGTPTYILRKELQDGATLNKWKPRSWLGVYVGTSNCHASAVLLIYNSTSTHVLPQYHVVYDEYFLTVNSSPNFELDAYLAKLYQLSAKWIYKDPYTEHPHLFESFWDPPDNIHSSRKRDHQASSSSDLRGRPALGVTSGHLCNTFFHGGE